MNILAFRRVCLEGEDLLLESEGRVIRIPAVGSRLQTPIAGGAHKLGIRPVDIEIRPPDGAVTIRGEVLLRERLGDHDRFLIDCAGESVVAEAPTHVAGAAGAAVGLFFPSARVHLFDGTSGRRLFVPHSVARAA